jgi:UPF0716 protein FxsA
MLRIIGVLLLVPLLDLLLLVVLTGIVGWEIIALAVVLTALVGMLLVRAEGRHTMRNCPVTNSSTGRCCSSPR